MIVTDFFNTFLPASYHSLHEVNCACPSERSFSKIKFSPKNTFVTPEPCALAYVLRGYIVNSYVNKGFAPSRQDLLAHVHMDLLAQSPVPVFW